MRKIVRRYVRNCHECQRIKIFRNRKNDLLILLIIFLQRWINISIDFITRLSDVHDYNVICTIIDKLNKKRHYAFCTTKNESTNVEVTTKILISYVFRIHDLLFFIIFDRDSQFISLVWQTFCRIFDIKCKLFTIFHSEIDDQIEKINQNIERQLQQYCNYMQNDWDVWLLMIEFVDNNAISASTELSSFFVNKEFHSRMSFSSNSTSFVTTRKRFLIVKTKNIIDTMQNILNYVRDHVEMIQKRMTIQINKHRKIVKYVEKNFVFLNRRNIKIVKSFDKLDDKKLNSFKMLQRLDNVYRLELSEIMRIHDVFHCWFLRKNLCDLIEEQINESLDSVIINENFEWKWIIFWSLDIITIVFNIVSIDQIDRMIESDIMLTTKNSITFATSSAIIIERISSSQILNRSNRSLLKSSSTIRISQRIVVVLEKKSLFWFLSKLRSIRI